MCLFPKVYNTVQCVFSQKLRYISVLNHGLDNFNNWIVRKGKRKGMSNATSHTNKSSQEFHTHTHVYLNSNICTNLPLLLHLRPPSILCIFYAVLIFSFSTFLWFLFDFCVDCVLDRLRLCAILFHAFRDFPHALLHHLVFIPVH